MLAAPKVRPAIAQSSFNYASKFSNKFADHKRTALKHSTSKPTQERRARSYVSSITSNTPKITSPSTSRTFGLPTTQQVKKPIATRSLPRSQHFQSLTSSAAVRREDSNDSKFSISSKGVSTTRSHQSVREFTQSDTELLKLYDLLKKSDGGRRLSLGREFPHLKGLLIERDASSARRSLDDKHLTVKTRTAVNKFDKYFSNYIGPSTTKSSLATKRSAQKSTTSDI